MGASLSRGSVVLLRSRHRLDPQAKVRVEGFDSQREAYSGIQLGMGYKPGITVLPPLRIFRGNRVAAVWANGGFQHVLPGVI